MGVRGTQKNNSKGVVVRLISGVMVEFTSPPPSIGIDPGNGLLYMQCPCFSNKQKKPLKTP